MRMKKIMSVMLAVACALSFAGCGKKKEEVNKTEKTNAQNVTVYTAKASDIASTVSYTGEVKAAESVSVSAKVGAKALKVNYKDGDYVKKGATLLVLDSTDIKLAYNQAEAGYNSAVASYNMVVNSTTKQAIAGAKQALEGAQLAYDSAKDAFEREKALLEQNSNVKLAEQSFNDAKTNYERQKELYDNNTTIISAQNAVSTSEENLKRTQQLFDMGAASQIELDTAKTTLENAKAALETASTSAKAQLDAAESGMKSAEENLESIKISASAGYDAAENALKNAENAVENASENVKLTEISAKESIATAEASVASAKASLATAKNSLNNTSVTAPISGYIASKNVNVGQMVSPGVELFSIKDSSSVDAEIEVTESVIPFINVGTPAKISIKSASIDNKEGTVTQVNSIKNAANGMYTVRVSIENQKNEIKVGMFADIELTTEQSNGCVIIPSDSIMQSGEEMYVFVAKGKKAERRTVEIGIRNSDFTEILAGVSVGEDVVVSGKEYLSEKNNELNITSKEER